MCRRNSARSSARSVDLELWEDQIAKDQKGPSGNPKYRTNCGTLQWRPQRSHRHGRSFVCHQTRIRRRQAGGSELRPLGSCSIHWGSCGWRLGQRHSRLSFNFSESLMDSIAVNPGEDSGGRWFRTVARPLVSYLRPRGASRPRGSCIAWP